MDKLFESLQKQLREIKTLLEKSEGDNFYEKETLENFIKCQKSHPDYDKPVAEKQLCGDRTLDMRYMSKEDFDAIAQDIRNNYDELELPPNANPHDPKIVARYLDKVVGDYDGVIGKDGEFYPCPSLKEYFSLPKELLPIAKRMAKRYDNYEDFIKALPLKPLRISMAGHENEEWYEVLLPRYKYDYRGRKYYTHPEVSSLQLKRFYYNERKKYNSNR